MWGRVDQEGSWSRPRLEPLHHCIEALWPSVRLLNLSEGQEVTYTMKITVSTFFRSYEDWMKKRWFQGQILLNFVFALIKYNWVVSWMRHFDIHCNDFLKKKYSWTKCSPKTARHWGGKWVLALAGKPVERARPTDEDVPHLSGFPPPLLSSGKPLSQSFQWDECQRHSVYLYILVIIGCVLSHCESITHSQKNDHQPVPTDTSAYLGCVCAFRFTGRLGSPKVCLSFIFGWW